MALPPFHPRIEAHAMHWDKLMPPVRRAVLDLLVKLGGAHAKVSQNLDPMMEYPHFSNCFFVGGDHGTGKSTVVVSARAAVKKSGEFFKGLAGSANTLEKQHWQERLPEFNDLQRAAWLDVLDLEPLPATANLLTALLSRILNSLNEDSKSGSSSGLKSLFEENDDSARNKLQRLINDATLMWEDIAETDTRSRADRQIKAADIYASYPQRFKEAMRLLSEELGRRDGNKPVPIILPIDNIDRSTEHLYGIIKLAQMVNSRHLWLVIIGKRDDLDTFLERAHWKELVRVGTSGVAIGNAGPYGADDGLTIARRQAAAAIQKLLPPSHRIEVEYAKPEETLEYRPTPALDSICQLLRKIELPHYAGVKTWKLLDLFEIGQLLQHATRQIDSPDSPESDNPPQFVFTRPGQRALTLPARRVLDLWQVANVAAQDKNDRFPAETVARTMFRNIVSQSDMTSEWGRRLQDQVIQRRRDGGTLLDFTETELKVFYIKTTRQEYPLDAICDGEQIAVMSEVNLNELEEICIQLCVQREGNHTDKMELPVQAASWLMILHDIAVRLENSIVLKRELATPPLVTVSHQFIIDGEPIEKAQFRWEAPAWETFVSREILCRIWEKTVFAKEQAGLSSAKVAVSFPDLMHRLAKFWLSSVLKTMEVMNGVDSYKECVANSEQSELQTAGPFTRAIEIEEVGAAISREIDEASDPVPEWAREACQAYTALDGNSISVHCLEDKSICSPFNERLVDIEWARTELPKMFSYLMMPTKKPENGWSEKCLAGLMPLKLTAADHPEDHGLLRHPSLQEAWRRNHLFTRAKMKDKMQSVLKALSRFEDRETKSRNSSATPSSPQNPAVLPNPM